MNKMISILIGCAIFVSCSADTNSAHTTTAPIKTTPTTVTSTTVKSTTTTIPKLTTTVASTTTVDPIVEADAKILFMTVQLDSTKQEMADIIEDGVSLVESVDLIAFDTIPPLTVVLNLAVTTGFNGIEYRDEVAWELARLTSIFWETDGGLRNDIGTFKPTLVLTVDTTTYIASYDMMVAVADLNMTSVDWLNFARQ